MKLLKVQFWSRWNSGNSVGALTGGGVASSLDTYAVYTASYTALSTSVWQSLFVSLQPRGITASALYLQANRPSRR